MIDVKKPADPPHYAYIDALRGVALLAVLAFHVGHSVHGLPRLLSDALSRGYAGVQLFFVVSCFTLCASLRARSGDRRALAGYLVRRLFRIAPMFWFAIALYISIYGLGSGWSARDGGNLTNIALSMLLLHGFDVNAINGAVPGGWSVATEVQFYLILPLLVGFATSLRRAIAIWIGALAISALAQPVLMAVLAPHYPEAQQDLVHQFAFYTLPAQLPVFVCGLVVFRLMGADRDVLNRIELRLPSSRRLRQAAIFAIVLIVGLPLDLSSASPSLMRSFPGHVGYGVLAALLVYAFAIYPKNSLVQSGLRFVGQISYSAYLLHFAMLDAAERLIPSSVASQPILHLALLGLLAATMTFAAAWLTFTLIEKPGIAMGRRLIALFLSRRPSPLTEHACAPMLGQSTT